MKKCLICKNEFEKGKVVGGHLGLAWIIFIFLSMGIGFIFWLFFRGEKKEICPYCKSENIIDIKFYNGNSDRSDKISTQKVEYQKNKQEEKDRKLTPFEKLITVVLWIIAIIIVSVIINSLV